MSKKKNVIARVGNCEITKDCGPDHDYLRIKAINGHWGISYRDDNEMYGKSMGAIKDPALAETLEATVYFLFQFTNTMVDKEFVTDFAAVYFSMQESKNKDNPESTEQEQADALAEVEMMEDIKKDLTK